MTADQIIAAARSALDIPFRHQGRNDRGLDCAGLIVHVCRRLGVEYADREGYGRRPHDGLIESAMDAQPAFERIAEPEPGAVLLMRFAKEPQHLAIYTGENLIHSYSNVGKVCEHRLSDVWRARIVRAYRFRGIEQ